VENAALRSVITAVFDLGPNARRLLGLLLAELDGGRRDVGRDDAFNGEQYGNSRNGEILPRPEPKSSTFERRQRRERRRLAFASPSLPRGD
jgi:hypothetical protein